MKRTIVWPPKVRGGRLAMTEDPDSDPLDPDQALRQVIRVNLMDGGSTNPWNTDAGLTDQTFQRNAPRTKARIRSRVRQVFRRLERSKRAKLVEITFPRDPSDLGTLHARITYVNLETQGRQSMEISPNARS